MEDLEITPDFDIGICSGSKSKAGQQSTSSDSESGTASDASPQEADKPNERKDEGQDEEEDSTREQLNKLLDIPKVQPKPPKPETQP